MNWVSEPKGGFDVYASRRDEDGDVIITMTATNLDTKEVTTREKRYEPQIGNPEFNWGNCLTHIGAYYQAYETYQGDEPGLYFGCFTSASKARYQLKKNGNTMMYVRVIHEAGEMLDKGVCSVGIQYGAIINYTG